jgi:glutamate dehydrogenase
MDIIEAATINQMPVCEVAGLYFALGARLELDWFRNEIGQHRVSNNWDALARAACRDDLDRQQRGITEGVLRYLSQGKTQDEAISSWLTAHKILLERWFYMLNDLKATKSREFTMFAVALRELLDLAQASTHATALMTAAKGT